MTSSTPSSQLDQGLPFLRKAVEADPADMHAWSNYTDALLQSRQLIDARNTLQECRKQGFTSVRIFQLVLRLSVAAEAWLSSQSGSGASPSGSKFKIPGNFHDLCQAEVPTRQQEACLATFTHKEFAKFGGAALDQAIRYPMASFSWKVLAAAYQSVAKHDEAEAAYVRSIKLRPGDEETHFNRGQNFSAQRKWVAAAELDDHSRRDFCRTPPIQ